MKYIYIVSHHSSWEHRALTKFRHLTRFLVSTLTSFHVFALMSNLFEGCSAPCCSGSASGSGSLGGSILGLLLLCHLVVGEVCGPATPHSLCQISNSIGLCLALAHSSWFGIWTSQNTFSILQMHLLTRMCS